MLNPQSGSSIFETAIALALLSFIILAALNSQTKSLADINQSQIRLANYLQLNEWKLGELTPEACSLLEAYDHKALLKCTKKDAALRKEAQTILLLN